VRWPEVERAQVTASVQQLEPDLAQAAVLAQKPPPVQARVRLHRPLRTWRSDEVVGAWRDLAMPAMRPQAALAPPATTAVAGLERVLASRQPAVQSLGRAWRPPKLAREPVFATAL